MTLMKLTSHEAGIILYGDNTVAVWNWGQCDGDQIPMLSPLGFGAINWPEEAGVFEGASYRRFKDVRDEIPGSVWVTDEADEAGNRYLDTDLDIVSDENNDLARLFLGVELEEPHTPLTPDDYEGAAYTLRDGRVILVLDMWN